MEKNPSCIEDANKENYTNKQPQLENRLFILKSVLKEVELPCALESGERVCSDGRWVKVTHKDRQTFYRCGRRFELSVGMCFVGRQLPFFERHRNINGVILLLVGSLSVALAAHFWWGSAGSASSLLTQPQESIQNGLEAHILSNSNVSKTSRAVSAAQEVSPRSDTPAASHPPAVHNRKPSIATDAELDPLRCTPLRSRGEQRPAGQSNINVKKGERTWYVCR